MTAPPTNAKAARQDDLALNKLTNRSSQTGASRASLCEEIKARLTLRESARMVGVELPERDNVRFRSPLRPDRNPSCTISTDTMRDWSRGESFDAISLYATAKGISNGDAVRELANRLNITTRNHSPKTGLPAPSAKPKPKPLSFDGIEPTDQDFAAILQARKLSPKAEAGLVLAHAIGVLHFAKVGGFPSWLVSDESRFVAEARRLDGKSFPAVGSLGERKAHTLKGSTKSWPVGLMPRVKAGRLRSVPLVLVEGSPDLLAAYTVLAILPMDARDVQPVAMLGTSLSISAEALQLMAGRPAVVLAHGDQAGSDAARRWAEQLTKAGCRVKVRDLPDGQDLNDAVDAHGLDAMKGVILP
jgi:hypothetical protein